MLTDHAESAGPERAARRETRVAGDATRLESPALSDSGRPVRDASDLDHYSPGNTSWVAWLRCEAIRWVSDEPFPGWIEVALTDADGQVWRLFDKPPIFEHNVPITQNTRFPVGVVVEVDVLEEGDPVVVSTAPCGVMSEEGQQEFRVPAKAIEH